jgi:hypothetical protein
VLWASMLYRVILKKKSWPYTLHSCGILFDNINLLLYLTNILEFSKCYLFIKGIECQLARDGVVICVLGYKNKYSINFFCISS